MAKFVWILRGSSCIVYGQAWVASALNEVTNISQEACNPAAPAAKTLYEVMKIAKRYLQKGETIYETKTYAGGGHQAGLRPSVKTRMCLFPAIVFCEFAKYGFFATTAPFCFTRYHILSGNSAAEGPARRLG